MKVKVSNPMVKLIRETLPKYKISLEKLSLNQYECFVGDLFENEVDYDYNKNQFKVIKIVYPPEYYACNKYITTNDLNYIFRNTDKTLEGFKKGLLDYCLI